MDLNEKHQGWEEEAPELAKIPRDNPFVAPEGYFEALTESVHARISMESLNLSKETGFTVTDEYFETLPEKIEASIALQKLKEEMKSEGFTVPEGYFDQLNSRISERVQQQQPKVRKLVPAWLSLAAAACVTVALGIGLLLNNGKSNIISADLSQVPEQEIINYLQLYSDQMDSQVIVENIESNAFSEVSDEVSAQELKYYLEDTSL